MRWIVFMTVLGLSLAAAAQNDQWTEQWVEIPPPPEMPESAPPALLDILPPVVDTRGRELGQLEEADVILIERPDHTLREFWLAGHLFMVEVIPRVGLPYYLLDTTGDGILDTRHLRLGPHVVVPQWILHHW